MIDAPEINVKMKTQKYNLNRYHYVYNVGCLGQATTTVVTYLEGWGILLEIIFYDIIVSGILDRKLF